MDDYEVLSNKVCFAGYLCRVVKTSYAHNGATALQLVDATDDSPLATATINIPGLSLDTSEAVLKTYSENEGMLETLADAGIVRDTGRRVQTPYVSCPVVRILAPGNPA